MITVGSLWQQMFKCPMYSAPPGCAGSYETDLTRLPISSECGKRCEEQMRKYEVLYWSVDQHPDVTGPLLASLRFLLEIYFWG